MANRLIVDRESIERECLEHARAHIEAWVTPDGPHQVHELKLEGIYPDTRIVVAGDHTYGGSWRVRFPIWDPRNGGTRDGEPMPSFIGMLVCTEVLEA
jgi:hypothetical protein